MPHKLHKAGLNPVEQPTFAVPSDLWSEAEAANLNDAELLLYRSNLLGSDLTITNFGGGNTSSKIMDVDPLSGEPAEVLWVKGSGGDIGSMKLDGFATLYQDRLRALEAKYRGSDHEDEMVGYLPLCTFNLNPRAASIDTMLHALLPFRHVDHVHPDAVIALAASTGGEAACRAIWGGRIGWLPWRRPGFELAVQLRNLVSERPELEGVILAGHGLICWGNDARGCYARTVGLIADAARHLNEVVGRKPVFGGAVFEPLPREVRLKKAIEALPILRAMVSQDQLKLAHFCDDAETMEFVCSAELAELAALGTSCPDHFLRTKVAPLVLDPELLDDRAYLEASFAQYRSDYSAYYQRCARDGDPAIRDSNPVIVLIPGLGRFAFAANKATARIASEFYGNAINVMRGAQALGGYIGLPESEAFAIEYWALEEAKLQRMPKPSPLAGRIAVITGGAGGIGAAAAKRLLAEGAHVVLLDRDRTALDSLALDLASAWPSDRYRMAYCDVTDEASVKSAFDCAVLEFGGTDILIANAGIASSAPLEQTDLATWRRNFDVLAEGYFLTSRAAFPLMREMAGGSIIFIGSKNGIAAATNASAYASAKAASLHLARCLALEGAPHGIRVNVVNPDAVIRGSRIWDGEWRKERAGAHGIDAGSELEEHYRNRSLLKRDVLPEDVAEAICFFAGDRSGKSTGNMLNVDAGNAQAFTR